MFKKRCIFGEYERNPPKYIVNVMRFLMISVRKMEIYCDGIMNGGGVLRVRALRGIDLYFLPQE